jgi:excisionase family DNA binding protein
MRMNEAATETQNQSSPDGEPATAAFPNRPRGLIDLPAVARWLGVSQRHVRRLVFERRIPFIKWGQLLRFDPDEIEAWIEAARVPARRKYFRGDT